MGEGRDEDRVVSRRVDNPTAATEQDRGAYEAADPPTTPATDTDRGGAGGTAERAGRDLGTDDESEPERSE